MLPSLTYSRRMTALADNSSSPSLAAPSGCFPHLNDFTISLHTTSTLLRFTTTTGGLVGRTCDTNIFNTLTVLKSSMWSEVQTCIWSSRHYCHSLSLASVKSRLVLPFWYRLNQVIPDKGPLNRCVCGWITQEIYTFTKMCLQVNLTWRLKFKLSQ